MKEHKSETKGEISPWQGLAGPRHSASTLKRLTPSGMPPIFPKKKKNVMEMDERLENPKKKFENNSHTNLRVYLIKLHDNFTQEFVS
jgi:hypothetical protein